MSPTLNSTLKAPQMAYPVRANEITEALDAIRLERQPTRRGIILCAAAMAQMLHMGWKKDDLDSLEILWWSLHNGNGEPKRHLSEKATKSFSATSVSTPNQLG